MNASGSMDGLGPYVPRLVGRWLRDCPELPVRELTGSIVFVDVSGFTQLSERLARQGRVGAEILTERVGDSFAELLSVAYDNGGGLLKFGGDALLLWFSEAGHESRACRAAFGMRRMLRRVGRVVTPAGSVTLRLSVGVHSGRFHFFLVGGSHRELLVTGPAATEAVRMESAASAGQIVISPETAAALPRAALGDEHGPGRFLRSEPPSPGPAPAFSVGETLDVAGAIPVAVRQHLSAGGDDPEHRQVTVAFVHFAGTDGFIRERGAEALAEVLGDLVTSVQSAAEGHGVAFLGTDIAADGGKVILVAGAPRATGDHEERMLLAVRQIVEAQGALPLRAGVNRGHVFAGDVGPAYRRTYTVMGDTVNVAARLMAAARPGQVLAAESVLTRSRGRFETTPLPPLMVKGKKRPVVARAVCSPERGQRGTGPAAEGEGSKPPLVGREREMALLTDFLDAVGTGEGRVLQVRGEPGVGKSRLMGEVRRGARDATFLSVSGELYEASTPLFAFRELMWAALGLDRSAGPPVVADRLRARVRSDAPDLEPWLPLLGAPLDASFTPTPETKALDERFRQARLAQVVSQFLGAVLTGPTVIVFEDAQWMDDASSGMLHRLVADAAGRPWLVLVTRREGPGGFVLEEASHSLSIRISPLRPAEATALAELLTHDMPIHRHDLEGLAERSGGNPLFLMELLAARAAGMEAMPESIEDVIAARIDQLDRGERAFLRLASVLGVTFHASLLAEALGEPLPSPTDPMWARLEEFLEREPDDRLRFRQTLVRDSAYESLPFRTRQALHARVGQALLASGDPDEHTELLALHFFHAGLHREAWRFARLAGDRATAKYANVEAAQFYQRAVESARRAGGVEGADLSAVHEALGDVWERLGEFTKAGAAYRSARRLVRGNAVVEARLLLKEAWIPERGGRYSQALGAVTRAHRVLDKAGGDEAASQRARLSAAYAAILQAQGRNRDAVRWCLRAVAEAEAARDRDALAHAFYILSWAGGVLGDLESERYARNALAIYEDLGNLARQALILNYLGASAYYSGEWDRALEYYERGREAREKTGDLVNAAYGTLNIGEILLDQGRLDEAEEHLRAALRVWQAAQFRGGVALATTYLGRVASRGGRFVEALALFDQARAEFKDLGDRYSVVETDLRIAECLFDQGQVERAANLAAEALASAEEGGGVSVHAAALLRVRGRAFAELGRFGEARASLQQSLDVARARKAAYDVALDLIALADLARRDGLDTDEAASLEREGRDILDRLGVVAVPVSA